MLPGHHASFYKNYAKNYFRIKASLLRHEWEASEAFFAGLENLRVDGTEAATCLKLEIRGVFFQAIETLFELIFALESGNDANIWQSLVDAPWSKNYARIQAFSEGSDGFLDKKLSFPGKDADSLFEPTFLQYVFFFIYVPDLPDDGFQKTLSFIREFLVVAAREFSDRDDYNAYKHGLRLFPTIVGMNLSNSLATVDLDFGDTYTILRQNDPYTHHIKTFDIDRDLRMINVCGEFISNIINFRKFFFFPDAGYAGYYYYADEDVSQVTSPNLKAANISFSVTPVFREQNETPSGEPNVSNVG